MNDYEIIFFEEYKRLDGLCKDILNSDEGISAYIKEMENTPYNKSRLVNDWQSIYKSLKHIRWVRNNIAHKGGDSGCEESDLIFVDRFRKSLMNQEDPFSVIYKSEYASRTKSKINKNSLKNEDKNRITEKISLLDWDDNLQKTDYYEAQKEKSEKNSNQNMKGGNENRDSYFIVWTIIVIAILLLLLASAQM